MNKFLIFVLLCFSSLRTIYGNWISDGLAKPTDSLTYTIALKQNNMFFLKEYLLNISDPYHKEYGKYLTKEQISEYVASKPSDILPVLLWLHNNRVKKYKFYGDSFQCTDKISNIEGMFNVKIYKFVNINTKEVVLKSKNNYQIPTNLIDNIVFIDGISNKLGPVYRPPKKKDTSDNGFVSREVINRIYNINSSTIIKNTSVGAIEFQGGGFSESDLNKTQLLNGINARSVYKVIGPNLGGGTESKLDMQMLATTAPEVELWYINYNQWLYQMATDLFNRDEVPDILSISYGWAERDQCTVVDCKNLSSTEYVNRVNNEFIKLSLRGITLVVASGDAGSPGRTNEGCDRSSNLINPVLPGSSPWITSVGATFILDNNQTWDYNTPICKVNKCASGNDTQSIDFNTVGWTTGAGFGIYESEKRPKWQEKVVDEYLNSGVFLPNSSNWNKEGRGYPDVSAVGHNCPVYNQFQYEDVDGTSCSAPVFAGILAILNDHQVNNGRPKLGFVNPLLYQMAVDKTTTFRKSKVTNTHCTEYQCCSNEFGFEGSGTRWDPVGGLGEPNVGEMIKYLDYIFN